MMPIKVNCPDCGGFHVMGTACPNHPGRGGGGGGTITICPRCGYNHTPGGPCPEPRVITTEEGVPASMLHAGQGREIKPPPLWDGYRAAYHQICRNCWYSSCVTMSEEPITPTKNEAGGPLPVLQCRRHTPDRWELVCETAWCGEGRWNEPAER